MKLRFEPLGRHDRASFSCGSPELDDWFRHRAGQDDRRNISRVFVAVDDELGVVGFYSLSSFAVSADRLPAEMSRKLPRYGLIPALLLGRLGRDLRVRGQGVGERLLVDALERSLAVGASAAASAVVVDAKDEAAAGFYQDFGFKPSPDLPLRLYLPLETAADGFRLA